MNRGGGAKFTKSQKKKKITVVMHMDDIKLFSKNGKEFKTIIETIKLYSQDIEMEFGIEKCALLIMRSGKRQITEAIEIPNQERIRSLGEKETCKYSEKLEAVTIKQVEVKEKKLKRVFQTNEKNQTSRNQTQQQKSHQRDKHLGCPPL